LTNQEEIANTLNEYFQSVFSTDESSSLPAFTQRTKETCNPSADQIITVSKIIDKLKSLDSNKAIGPDKIHNMVLKSCAEAFSIPLEIIFRKSFEAGELPTVWKQANVSPVHKSGSRVEAKNYRPVSLTCVLCKVMESLIKDIMLQHLIKNKLICEAQHGFLPFKSCVTNLLESLDIITKALAEGFPVDVIYTDFAKAFDKVCHRKLLYKLKFYGFGESLIKWIRGFLVGRSQKVVLGNAESTWRDVHSGVPQGSVLGPLLFIIYINDLLESIQTNCKAYADDTKLIAIIQSLLSIDKLQDDIDRISKWSVDWSTQLNAEKCKVVHFGSSNTCFEYDIKSGSRRQQLAKSSCEKDLGIFIKNDLKWDVQVQSCTSKANRILGMINKAFKFKNKNNMKLLYSALVRPHLEYAISSWCPHLEKDIKEIEKVQRRATKLIPEFKDLDYNERLAKLKLTDLRTRRLRGDLIQFYKIINRFENVNFVNGIKYCQSANPDMKRYNLRRHSKAIQREKARFLPRHNFLVNRVVNDWNKLPEEVISAPNVNNFKKKLDDWMERNGATTATAQ
jgi:hypothetical protein